MSSVSELQLTKLCIREVASLLNTSAESTKKILSNQFDATNPCISYPLKRPLLLAKAHNLNIQDQILGVVPFVPKIFNEQDTLQSNCLVLIESEVKSTKRAARERVVNQFKLLTPKAIIAHYNMLSPHDKMEYPQSL